MITPFATLAICCYALSAILLMRRIVHHERAASATIPLALAVTGSLAHIGFLTQAILVAPGQNMSITNVLSLVAWLITGSMLLFYRVLPNLILLPVVVAFAAITVLVSLIIPVEHIMHIQLQQGLVVHVTLSLFAYGVLVIAFLYALQMSYITYKLKQKGSGLLHSTLPPLMMVEGMMFKLLQVGTGLLVISLLSGFVFLDNMFSALYAHKTVLSLLALLVYVVVLVGQKVHGWRARQVIILNVIGVLLLTLGYFGSRFVREVLL